MTNTKQTVLTDDQNAIIAARFPDDPANACRAQSAIVEILSKLRGAGEPSEVISVHECDAVPYVHPEFGPGIFFTEDCRIAAPQASAEATALRSALLLLERTASEAWRIGERKTDEWDALGAALGIARDVLKSAPAAQAPAKGAGDDWRLDHSAGRPILVYQNCSVIEAEQAEYVLRLIEADRQQRGGDVAAVLRQFLTGDGFIAECDIPHIVNALTARKGESNE